MSSETTNPDDMAPAAGPEVPRCGNCLFYVPTDVQAGECHAGPPGVVGVPTSQGLAFGGTFPRVSPDTWCGEFEAKDHGEKH